MSKHPKLVSVQVRNGNIQKALKIFKRRIDDSGHLQLLRTKQQYTKPTTKRRKQNNRAHLNSPPRSHFLFPLVMGVALWQRP